MLRVELDPADLLATRFETRPGPLGDVTMASRALRRRTGRQLAGWRKAVLPRLTQDTVTALMLQPPTGISFGFTGALGDLEEGLDTVLGTPKRVLREEVEDFVLSQGTLPARFRDLAGGDLPTLRQISAGLRSMHEVAISPYQTQLELVRDTDVALRAPRAARDGLAAAINDIHPSLRLRGMVLEADRPYENTVRSGGHGLVFVPSPWLDDEVRLNFLEDGPIVIFYPVALPLLTPRSGAETPLGRLLGGTRARLLAALAEAGGQSGGTLALAAGLGISAATASEHLAVLRNARLVATHRDRTGAVHTLTPTGRQLLGVNLR